MTDHTQTDALAAVRNVQTTTAVARAHAVLDALDAHWEELDRSDRYDIAAETWRTATEYTDARVPDGDIVRLIVRVADHVAEATVVDLIDAHFGEHEQDITAPGGYRLTWIPAEGVLILVNTDAHDVCIYSRSDR